MASISRTPVSTAIRLNAIVDSAAHPVQKAASGCARAIRIETRNHAREDRQPNQRGRKVGSLERRMEVAPVPGKNQLAQGKQGCGEIDQDKADDCDPAPVQRVSLRMSCARGACSAQRQPRDRSEDGDADERSPCPPIQQRQAGSDRQPIRVDADSAISRSERSRAPASAACSLHSSRPHRPALRPAPAARPPTAAPAPPPASSP